MSFYFKLFLMEQLQENKEKSFCFHSSSKLSDTGPIRSQEVCPFNRFSTCHEKKYDANHDVTIG